MQKVITIHIFLANLDGSTYAGVSPMRCDLVTEQVIKEW